MGIIHLCMKTYFTRLEGHSKKDRNVRCLYTCLSSSKVSIIESEMRSLFGQIEFKFLHPQTIFKTSMDMKAGLIIYG
jgi:hypothetical protein